MQRVEQSFNNEPIKHEIENTQRIKEPSVTGEFPSFYKRYFALLIDTIFVFVLFYLILSITEYLLGYSVSEQYLYFALIAFIYDALLTSKLCTVGQLLFGFRIRNDASYRKISLTSACIRTTSKWLLGWISIIVIVFNKQRRAVHDIMSGSIALSPKQVDDLRNVSA
jgi:uncharacterized RDD family membrane protein YckC